jgi:hypothetical protein
MPGLGEFAKTHRRPVVISTEGKRQTATARFDLRNARIDLPDQSGQPTWIDRRTGAWHGIGDTLLGQCAVPAAKSTTP